LSGFDFGFGKGKTDTPLQPLWETRVCVTNARGTTFNHIFDKTTTVIARGNQKYETPVLKVNAVNKV